MSFWVSVKAIQKKKKENNKKQKQRIDRNPIRGKGVVTRLHKYFFLGVPPSLPLVSGPGRSIKDTTFQRNILSFTRFTQYFCLK